MTGPDTGGPPGGPGGGGPGRISDALPKRLIYGALIICSAVLAVVALWPGVVR